MTDQILIAPSILSADFGALRESIGVVEGAGADLIHVDVMDGHFVPNLTIGPPVVRALKECGSLPLDVHLMIDNADDTVDWYLDAGADWLTVHAEACAHLDRVVARVRESGVKAGVSLNPGTPIDVLDEVLATVDMVLVMSVNPGFGGQSFIPAAVSKVARLAAKCDAMGVSPVIAVDGGIDVTTAPMVVGAGARFLVAGSAIFGADDPAEAVPALRAAASASLS